jgi:hypothetical protein
MAATVIIQPTKYPHESPIVEFHTSCEGSQNPKPSSWIRREVLGRIGIPLPTPRVVNSKDPALKLPRKCIEQRRRDEVCMLRLLEKAPTLKNEPQQLRKLGEDIFEVTYGKGVTAQIREDFLIKYGCTGWTIEVLEALVELCEARGIVEIGAGHGQWSRAISDFYEKLVQDEKNHGKKFEFVLAYDDMSGLPLNTHIYNQYTQPHHEYFGSVKKIESPTHTQKLLQSWVCRGRALLMVYPPPGGMALDVIKNYVSVPENDMIIYVGEGRGGANGNDSLFDFFESGDWILLKVMDVLTPPGDKGYEKLYVLQRHTRRG